MYNILSYNIQVKIQKEKNIQQWRNKKYKGGGGKAQDNLQIVTLTIRRQ